VAENTIVCERALLLLPKLKQYVAAVAAGTCAKPQHRSFEVIRESSMDNLLTAKLHSCQLLSRLNHSW